MFNVEILRIAATLKENFPEGACKWDEAVALKLRELTEDLKTRHIQKLQGNVDYFQVNYYKPLISQGLIADLK